MSLAASLSEVKPSRNISKGRKRLIVYSRVNVAFLTPKWIIKKYEEKSVKKIPSVIATCEYFIIQHDHYPPFYIGLDDGRLYCLPTKNLDLEHTERTASIFLEIIRERVEGFRMLDIDPKVSWA